MVRKAPGDITKIAIGSKSVPKRGKPSHVPAPSISLTDAISIIANANPAPIPRPSIIDEIGVFFDANASALPKIMQLTTINDMKFPNDLLNAGKNPAITISTNVTKDAMTIIKIGIRIFAGTPFRMSEMTKLEQTNTNVVAALMPMALLTEEEVARTGQRPSIRRSTGFSR